MSAPFFVHPRTTDYSFGEKHPLKPERLRRSLRDLALPHEGSEKGVITVSVGIASYSGTAVDRRDTELLRRADQALYDAKAAGRDRVTDPAKRKRWMGVNGGLSSTLFVDGWLEGLWRVEDGRPVVVELFRDLTPGERSGLDAELDRVTALLAK